MQLSGHCRGCRIQAEAEAEVEVELEVEKLLEKSLENRQHFLYMLYLSTRLKLPRSLL